MPDSSGSEREPRDVKSGSGRYSANKDVKQHDEKLSIGSGTLKFGDSVKIQGLVNAKQFNGLVGTLAG